MHCCCRCRTKSGSIDIVSDGEQTRQHFVTTFIEHLDGVDFEKRETVRIRNRYDASVPTVVGAVSRRKPVSSKMPGFCVSKPRKPSSGHCPAR
jgi:5-methyltetrahydropteroyltriglutamate--homocysteine methyltransferase